MLVQAHMAGADAVIGIRYDANEMMKGVTECCVTGQPFASSLYKKLINIASRPRLLK